MPRLARTILVPPLHHITQRGHRRGMVFFTDANRQTSFKKTGRLLPSQPLCPRKNQDPELITLAKSYTRRRKKEGLFSLMLAEFLRTQSGKRTKGAGKVGWILIAHFEGYVHDC